MGVALPTEETEVKWCFSYRWWCWWWQQLQQWWNSRIATYTAPKLSLVIIINIRRSWVCRRNWRSWAERGCTIIIFLIFPFLFTKQSSYSLYFLYCLLNKILQGCTARVRTNWLWTARSWKPAFRGCPSATRSYWWPQLHFWRKDVDWYLMKGVF